ncbi:MAG: hypothetical protein WC794_05840 [Candidatus Doudnabacteria bacterium]|jgi:hypothetical protein
MGKTKKKPMKKVEIKRIKRAKPKLSTKAKVLAGLGLGTTLAGFGAGGAGGKANDAKPMVRVQDQNKDSKTGKIKKLLTDTFGVPEAKGWYGATTGVNDGSADNDPFYGVGGGYWNQGFGSGGSPTSYTTQTQTDINAGTIYNNSSSNALNNLADQAAAQTESNQTGSGEAETEGSALPTDGQTEGLGEGSGEGYFPEVPTTPAPAVIQQGIDEMNNTPAPVVVGSDANGNQIYFNNGQYQDYTGNVYTSNIENGQNVFNPIVTTDPLNLGQGGTGDQVPSFPVEAPVNEVPQENVILNNTQANAGNFFNQPWQQPANAQSPEEIQNTPANVITNLETNEQYQGEGSGYVVGQDAQGNNIFQNSNGDWLDSSGNILQKQNINVTDSVTPVEYVPAVYNFQGLRTDNQVPEIPVSLPEQNNVSGISNYITSLEQQGVMTLLNTDGSYILLNTSTGQTEQKTLEQMVEASLTVGPSTQVASEQVQNLSTQNLADVNQQISSGLTADLIRNYISQTPEVAPEITVPISPLDSTVTENISAPSAPIMTQTELNAELAKYQSTPAEALATTQGSENNQTLNFAPLTLADGTTVTTANGVEYRDAGGNFYFYTGDQNSDLMKYDSKAGVFTSVSAVGVESSMLDQAKNTVKNITKTTAGIQDKANKGINAGIGAITKKLRGDVSDKADNLNLNPSKLKKAGKIAAIGGATVLAGPAGLMVAGVSSGSQTAWDKLVNWATNPENINRTGTVTWTNPATKEKFSFSKQEVQSVLAVIQANDFKINP